MSRPLRGRSVVAAAATVAGLLVSAVFARPDHRSIAIHAVQSALSSCEGCVFFALPATKVPAETRIIKKHDLYFVSTVDRVPPPFWWVAISPSGKPHILSANATKGWNEMMREENVKLDSDAGLVDFVRTFVEFGIGRAIYVDRLNRTEKKRLRKALGKMVSPTLKIIRTPGRIGLQFFAKDAAGALQWWDLIVKPTGQVVKAEARDF